MLTTSVLVARASRPPVRDAGEYVRRSADEPRGRQWCRWQMTAMPSPLALSFGEPPHVDAFFLRPSAPNSAMKAKPPNTSASLVGEDAAGHEQGAVGRFGASSPPPNPGPPIFCHTSVPVELGLHEDGVFQRADIGRIPGDDYAAVRCRAHPNAEVRPGNPVAIERRPVACPQDRPVRIHLGDERVIRVEAVGFPGEVDAICPYATSCALSKPSPPRRCSIAACRRH